MSATRKQDLDAPGSPQARPLESALDEGSRAHGVGSDPPAASSSDDDRTTILPGEFDPLPPPPLLPFEAELSGRRLKPPLPGVGPARAPADPEAPAARSHPMAASPAATARGVGLTPSGSPLGELNTHDPERPPNAPLPLELSYLPGALFPRGGPSSIPPPLPSEDDWELNLEAPQISALPSATGELPPGFGQHHPDFPYSAALTPRPGLPPSGKPTAPSTLAPPTPPLPYAATPRDAILDRKIPATRSALVASDPPGPNSPRWSDDEPGTAPWPPTEPLPTSAPSARPGAPGRRSFGEVSPVAASPLPPAHSSREGRITPVRPPPPALVDGLSENERETVPPPLPRPDTDRLPFVQAPEPSPPAPTPPPPSPTATLSEAAARLRRPAAAAPARAAGVAQPRATTSPLRESTRPPAATAAPFDHADRVSQMLDHLALGNYRVALGLADSVLLADASNGDAIQCAEMCRRELRTQLSATPQRELGVVERRPAGRGDEAAADPESQMLDKLSAGNYPAALRLAEAILAEQPGHHDAAQCAEMCRSEMRKMYADRLGSLSSVPRVVMNLGEIRTLSLDPTMGFLLARVDGFMSLEDIVDSSGIPALDALRSLYQLTLHEVIALDAGR